MTNIAIRTAAGPEVGYGHLRRCQTLAEELIERGVAPELWIVGGRDVLGRVSATGLTAESIAGDPDALLRRLSQRPYTVVFDDYGVNAETLRRARKLARVVVLDDLGDREIDADVVVNPAPYATQIRYSVPPECTLLLGPQYAVLKPGYRDARHPVRPVVNKILVTLGGSDPQGVTTGIVNQIGRALPDCFLDVVVGPLAERPALLVSNVRIHEAPEDLVWLAASTDLAVTGGGQTTYEMATAGIPSVVVELAQNQRWNIRTLAEAPTLLPTSARDVGRAVLKLATDHALRSEMAQVGPRIFDGLGAARVARIVIDSADANP